MGVCVKGFLSKTFHIMRLLFVPSPACAFLRRRPKKGIYLQFEDRRLCHALLDNPSIPIYEHLSFSIQSQIILSTLLEHIIEAIRPEFNITAKAGYGLEGLEDLSQLG
jgi:hypothetical protein